MKPGQQNLQCADENCHIKKHLPFKCPWRISENQETVAVEYKEAVLYACSANEWMQWTQMHIHLCWQTWPTKTRWVIVSIITFLNRFFWDLSSRPPFFFPGEVNSYIFKRHQFLKHQGYSDLDRAASTVVQSGKVQLRMMGTGWMMIMLHVGFPWFPAALELLSAFQIHSWTPIHSRILILQKYHMKCVLV